MTTTHHAKHLGYVLVAVFLLIVYSCSDKNSGIDIELAENQRIDEIAAGWWIKELDIENDRQGRYITNQMHYLLTKNGSLINKYNIDKDSLAAIWWYNGKTKALIIKEEVYGGSDGQNIWMTYEYPLPGIPWRKIIPADYQRLKPDRKHEHAVTIHSVADKGARLLLFGWGDYCTHISVF